MSPLRYHYQHRAELEAVVQVGGPGRDVAFDSLVAAVGTALKSTVRSATAATGSRQRRRAS